MKKYPRTLHLPFSPGATSDDKMASEEDLLSILYEEVVITEKLDGENNCMVKDGVYARSHGTFTDSPWSLEVRLLHSMIRDSIPDDFSIFGEGMSGIHSIEYTNLTSFFYTFGIREDGRWIHWDDVESYSYILELPTVPVLWKGKFQSIKELKDKVEELVKEPSVLGGPREGVVVRLQEPFLDYEFHKSVFKWVRKDHVTTDQHWTRNWKKAKLNKGDGK